jgi:hypothetical protein
LFFGGGIYLLASMDGIGNFNYKYKGYWGFVDALIGIASVVIGGFMFLLVNECDKIINEKKYSKLKIKQFSI